MICPICHSINNVTVLNNSSYPYFTVPVSKKNKRKILSQYTESRLSSPLIVKTCKDCGHSCLDPIPDQNILADLYSNYYTYPSPLKGEFNPERDNIFLNYFEKIIMPSYNEKNLNTVLEVGCYDGYVLYHLQQKGFAVTGCEPSEGAAIGKEHGVNIIRRFFSSEEFIKKNLTFDFVISRHFIEHVIDTEKWIESLMKILNPAGVLLIETPNIQFYLERGLLEVFSLQHVHGFSSDSLDYVLNKNEMNVIEIEKTPDNLIALAQKGSSSKNDNVNNWEDIITDFKKKHNKNKRKIKEIISEFTEDNKTIAMWGAGGFGLAAITLYDIPAEGISFYIDVDSNKWGMEYLNNAIPIISPQNAKHLKPDLIIITSMYSRSIKQQIAKMAFQTRILTIFPKISLNKIFGS